MYFFVRILYEYVSYSPFESKKDYIYYMFFIKRDLK